jgi:3',5'-cyclic AMP phosphodiesterase CpdA
VRPAPAKGARFRRNQIAAFSCAVLLACQSRAVPPTYADLSPDRSGPIAIVGDTQEALLVERLLFRHCSQEEPAQLVADMARQRPGLVVLLGDMVASGSSAADWTHFDELLAPLRFGSVPVLPLLGNHDYWGDPARALREAAARFPQLARRRWYARTYAGLGLVWLDSNRGELGEAAWEKQASFFGETIRAMDGDVRIRGVLVFDHHPPFTNGTNTGDDENVQAAFLPAFFNSRKALAFSSGHTHSYEHMIERGRTFLVSGGGGGPRVRLLRGARQRHQDLFVGPSPRPFHYLLVEVGSSGLVVSARGIGHGEPQARLIDRFEIPFVR